MSQGASGLKMGASKKQSKVNASKTSLCKRSLATEFVSILTSLNADEKELHVTYAAAKQRATAYQAAKQTFFESNVFKCWPRACQHDGFERWEQFYIDDN